MVLDNTDKQVDQALAKASVDSRDPPRQLDEAPAAARPAPELLSRAASTFWRFFTFCAGHRLWTACMITFVLTWTVELFIVQGYTLVFPNEVGPRFAFWAPKIRFVLDLLFISTLSIMLRRRWLIFVAIGSSFTYMGLITYFQYFLKPLSLLTVLSTWREAVQVSGLGTDIYLVGPVLLLLGVLAIKLIALVLSRKASMPRASAWLVGAVLVASYASLYCVTLYLDPLDAILTTRGVGRLGHIRGYLGPWYAEIYYLRDQNLLARALEQRKIDNNRITPEEADIPIRDRIVIVQAESLDTNILDYKVNGVEVTPFLNRLRKMSMYFHVLAAHANGSADADFIVLNGVRSSRDGNTYRISGYPYENTTPQILADCGFESYCYHGNTGEFYGRRGAYQHMGFTGLRFREELERDYDLKADSWGVRDRDVLRLSAQQLRTAKVPTFHFVITLTTHTPYLLLHQSEREIYPNPTSTAEHYINNMRYLDNCLRDYITSLGGGTTVMIYADHPTQSFAGFTSDRALDRALEYIPCLIYDSDQDLSKLQKTRDDPRATDGSWNLLDVANYLRTQIKRARGPSHAKADTDNTRTEKSKSAREATK
jgi:glucan phosphoethanolaminetransferase (alkaline phosphatase superfamily)